ncbi:UNVERIFIED_CONTAM: hypothetical protein PYX00_006844 [Menopon gallinae]|uniref:Right handed beta helix domain-containing protein n=1 Tax=Menopon gallinae TaxID=328185 RepID=A0AAW2HWV0_9NEOP
MFPEIITPRKSFPSRLQEFQTLLSEVEKSCSEIGDVWSAVFRDLFAPSLGWQALWILSEESCMKYDLMHPTAVIVSVDDYEWDDLLAVVTVKGVQDDIVLPSEISVHIIELHPIKDQDYDEDDLLIIADWLDKYRYFYKYLWYPWDAKINVKVSEWCESHLTNRLQIQSNIQNGVFDRNVIQYYNSLIDRSRHLEQALSHLNPDNQTKWQRAVAMEKCIEKKVLKLELNFFEDPDLRNDLLLLRQKGNEISFDDKREAIFIWGGGDCDTVIDHLNIIRQFINKDVLLKITATLQMALDDCFPGSLILLPTGCHKIKTMESLQMGGAIKGISRQGEVRIVADTVGVKRVILLSCYGPSELENLNICREEGICIQVFSNTLKITGCQIIGQTASASRGIVVLSGSRLILENCEIKGFKVGIAVQRGAVVSISNSHISNCRGGLKLSEHGKISLNNVEISNCSEYGVRFESAKCSTTLKGDLNLLAQTGNEDLEFAYSNVEMRNNNCNVLIEQYLDVFHLNSLVTDDVNMNSDEDDEDKSEYLED